MAYKQCYLEQLRKSAELRAEITRLKAIIRKLVACGEKDG